MDFPLLLRSCVAFAARGRRKCEEIIALEDSERGK